MTSSRHKGSSSPDESDANWLDDEDALQELYDHVADEEEEEEEEEDLQLNLPHLLKTLGQDIDQLQENILRDLNCFRRRLGIPLS